MARNNPTQKLASFAGLLTASDSYEIGLRGLTTADNVDISRAQKLARRPGYSRVYTGNVDRAWFGDGITLFTDGAALKRLEPDYTATTLRSDLTPSLPHLAAFQYGDVVYYSNGAQTGVVQNGVSRSYGLEVPTGFSVAATYGRLGAGTCLCNVTYVRNDAQESGAGVSVPVTLASGGGVAFSNLPVSSDPTVAFKNLYVSRPNGQQPMLAMTVTNATTDASYLGDELQLNTPLRTQFKQALPAFRAIEWHNGRILVASGRFLFYSDPFAHELTDLRYNYIPFSDEVLTIAVTNGVYVGTTKEHYFLAGDDVAEAVVSAAAGYGAVPGAPVYAEASQLDSGFAQQRTPFWVSTTGVVAGLDNGQLVNLTEKRATFTSDPKQATMYIRKLNGQNHFVSVIQT